MLGVWFYLRFAPSYLRERYLFENSSSLFAQAEVLFAPDAYLFATPYFIHKQKFICKSLRIFSYLLSLGGFRVIMERQAFFVRRGRYLFLEVYI